MNWFRAYLNRIQGRLITAFTIAALGTITIWYYSSTSISRFSDELETGLSGLLVQSQHSARLEALIVDQLAAARRFLLTGDVQALAEADSLARQAQQVQTDFLRREGVPAEDRQQFAQLLNDHTRTVQRIGEAHALARDGQSAEAQARLGDLDAWLNTLRSRIRSINLFQIGRIDARMNSFRLQSATMQNRLFILLVAVALVLLAFAHFTIQAIQRPLHRLVGAANQLGEGDLNVTLNGRMPDEFQVLAGAFTGMAGRFRTIVGETVSTANRIGASASDLSAISEQVAASSGEVSTAMVGITQGAEEQAFGLRTVNEALETMRSRARQIDGAAEQVTALSEQIGGVAAAKRQDVTRALGMLLEVRDLVRASGEEVHQLQRASEKISTFVESIQGIARQTNLLALNAAIEAARAGEHGRGFAVVADEVRKLADGSARAADEVATTVRQIQEQVDSVVGTMESGFAKVAGVEEASKGAESAFEEIVASVAAVRDAAARVAEAAEANRAAVLTVDGAVRSVGATAESHAASAQQVSAAAEEQSAATEEMSAASIELLASADRLKELVAGFRV
ncbi:MAG TPA: HAMP domain-containing methyl-accepting chemotaxis protein [Longimicrobiales bacterium]|nr:HAMP domain-containing methyl-accepting chemotaxis protein [Longimicrobiales bacterium]